MTRALLMQQIHFLNSPESNLDASNLYDPKTTVVYSQNVKKHTPDAHG